MAFDEFVSGLKHAGRRNALGDYNGSESRDEASEPPALVVQVGSTQLRYHLRCIEDLHAMLKVHGDWMPLGSADERKPATEGTVEAWCRFAQESGGRVVWH